ncbi:MAG: phosphatidylserine decarboxylase family protein [Salinivirgaceae bacterium]|nr:MAG: phosphatidylserine decarboxylase family protein [Salinivirgaceae bacterium]
MRIHKAGFRIILVYLLIVSFVQLGLVFFIKNIYLTAVFGVAFFLLLIFILRFFRVPNRTVNWEKGKVIAPADGHVVTIEEVEEPEFLNAKAIQISIFMSVWNVHINWFPFNGVMKKYVYHPGKFLMARHPKSSELNERTSLLLETEDGKPVVVRQIAGIVARRIESYVTDDNSQMKAGQEMGFIKFGSRVDLFLPLDSEIKVKIGQNVRGLVSEIAQLS